MTQFAAELVVSYSRTAEVGKRYLLEVDLQHDPQAWPLRSEEYPIRCIVDVEAFACEAVGDAAIVMHRFGGTYGPARFVLEALAATDAAKLRILLLDTRGSVVYSRALDPIRIVPQQPSLPPVGARHGAHDEAIVSPPRVAVPEADSPSRDLAVWIRNAPRSTGKVFDTVGSSQMTRGDLVVVFAKKPRLRPLGVYRVEREPRIVRSEDGSDRAAGTSVQCVRILDLPEPSPQLLEGARREIEAISDSTPKRTTHSLQIHQQLIDLLRTLFDASVEVRVKLEYMLIRPLSVAEFKVYREARLHALESDHDDHDRAARFAYALARDVEGNSSRTPHDVMQLWRNHARANFSPAHEGLGLCLDLGREDVDELDAVAARNRGMKWLHEHVLHHPNRAADPPPPSSEYPVPSSSLAQQASDVEDAYEYDVYISYSGSRRESTWLHLFFLPMLNEWLHVELGRAARCFFDRQIEPSAELPDLLEHVLQSSACFVPVYSPGYFTSERCMREWRAFSAMGRPILPIQFHASATYPEDARLLRMMDFTRFTFTSDAFRQTREFVEFEAAVKKFAATVALALDPRSAGAS